MADPLSITTGIITLYSALLQIKRLKEAYKKAPKIVTALEEECDATLKIIRHAKSRLDRLDVILEDDDYIGTLNIRDELETKILLLQPEIEALQDDLCDFLKRPTKTWSFDQVTAFITRSNQMRRLEEMHKQMAQKRQIFYAFQQALDGEHIVRLLQRHISPPSSPTAASVTWDWQPRRGSAATSRSSVSFSTLGSEILLDAIGSSRDEDVKMILKEMEVSPNFQTSEGGMHPLHIAAARDDKFLIDLLLQFGADTSGRDDEGKTPLHIAVAKDKKDAVELLLQKGADPNAQDEHGGTALWYAAYYASSPACLPLLLEKGAAVVNFAHNELSMPTALWAAAAANKLQVAELLLQNGADPNVPDEHDSTLLHKTNWPAARALAPLLLRHGAKTSIRDGEGRLPFHRAAETCRSGRRLADLMPEEGVDVADSEGDTALIAAAAEGSLPLVRWLVEDAGADVSPVNEWGNDAFYVACANGQLLCATYLLGCGRESQDINRGNKKGNTALHAAAWRGHQEVVTMLLELGADKAALTTSHLHLGRPSTPGEVARAAGHAGIADAIERFVMKDD